MLPTNGLLSFFFCQDQDSFGDVEKDALQFKVIYQENTDLLKRRSLPERVNEENRFSASKILFSKDLSFPSWVHPYAEQLGMDENDTDNYSEATSLNPETGKMLGYANEIQGYMEIECALASIGVTYGPEINLGDPDIKAALENQFDWILLFQVPSEVSGMMWGDTGTLYFWIRKQDLKNKDFSRCWWIEQCY